MFGRCGIGLGGREDCIGGFGFGTEGGGHLLCIFGEGKVEFQGFIHLSCVSESNK